MQDLQYSINYNSPWFYNRNISFYPQVTFDNINIKSDFDFNIIQDNIENNIENNIKNININEKNNFNNNLFLEYKFKCKCCFDISNVTNKIYKI